LNEGTNQVVGSPNGIETAENAGPARGPLLSDVAFLDCGHEMGQIVMPEIHTPPQMLTPLSRRPKPAIFALIRIS
jgi:hypothetical protein